MECVTSTSLVVMPPPEFWPDFIDIKKNHMNPKIKRPPYPHITMLSPFVAPKHFEEARSKLFYLLQKVKPFRIRMSSFKLFENGNSCTLYLEPEVQPQNALMDLYKLLEEAFPEVRRSAGQQKQEFEAHIGVGYFRDLTKARTLQTKYQKNWKPMDWIVNEIYITSRTSEETPFEVRVVAPLGKGGPTSPWKEIPLDSEISQCLMYQARTLEQQQQLIEEQKREVEARKQLEKEEHERALEEPKPVEKAPVVLDKQPFDFDEAAHTVRIARRVVYIPRTRPNSHHLSKWLYQEWNRWNFLPKSREKLANSIKQFCSVKVQVLTPEYIISKMKSEGYITVSNESNLKWEGKKFTGFPHISDDDHWSHGLEDVQVKLLVRVFRWGETQSHKTISALTSSILPMTYEKLTIPPASVITKLVEMQVLAIAANKKIGYLIFEEVEAEAAAQTS